MKAFKAFDFQSHPAMEDKLVRCTAGAIYDVAVDVRLGSATFCKWFAAELTAENGRQLYIPQGFAHGFQTLSPDTSIDYHIAQFFEPERTAGIIWNDPEIGVTWPLPPVAQSLRDLALPSLRALDRSLLMSNGVER